MITKTDRLRFNVNETQAIYCPWRQKERYCEYMGKCENCGRRCYAFTDGENDPRGPLGDNAEWGLHAEDYGLIGPDIIACAICANEYEALKALEDYAKKIWSN